jgi:hypothetical protein
MTTDRIVQYYTNNKSLVSQIRTDISMLGEKDVKLVEYALNKEWASPKYKLKNFVGNAQITPFAKLRQWLLEIKTREEGIESLEYEITKWEIEMARQEHKIAATEDPFDLRVAQLELVNVTKNQIRSKRRLTDFYLERQVFVDLINEFMATDEAKIPDGSGRTYFDILDTEEEDDYEHEYWTNRLGKQSACDLLFYGRIGTGNLDAILSMSPEQQYQTLQLAISYASQIQQIQTGIQKEVDEEIGKAFVHDSSLTLPRSVEELKQRMAQEPKPTPGPKPTITGDDLDVYST